MWLNLYWQVSTYLRPSAYSARLVHPFCGTFHLVYGALDYKEWEVAFGVFQLLVASHALWSLHVMSKARWWHQSAWFGRDRGSWWVSTRPWWLANIKQVIGLSLSYYDLSSRVDLKYQDSTFSLLNTMKKLGLWEFNRPAPRFFAEKWDSVYINALFYLRKRQVVMNIELIWSHWSGFNLIAWNGGTVMGAGIPCFVLLLYQVGSHNEYYATTRHWCQQRFIEEGRVLPLRWSSGQWKLAWRLKTTTIVLKCTCLWTRVIEEALFHSIKTQNWLVDP